MKETDDKPIDRMSLLELRAELHDARLALKGKTAEQQKLIYGKTAAR